MSAVPKISAGLLMCRHIDARLELLLVHPGGPYFARKDDGAWTIPKGLVDPDETPLAAALREFHEETGFPVPPEAALVPLGEIRQKGGKRVWAWAFMGDCDPSALQSDSFEMEWPRGSGRMQSFPEVDRAEFFDADRARVKVLAAQVPFIDRVLDAFG